MSELDEVFEETEEKSEVVSEESEVSEESKGEISEPPSEPTLVPVAALQDERRKAKAAKEEAEQLREQLKKFTGEDEPNPFEDPEKWKAFQRKKIELEYQEEKQKEINERIDKSRSQMLEAETDYVDIETLFTAMSLKDPSLADEMIMSPDPARFAYEHGKKYLTELQKKTLKTQIEDDPIPAPSLATKTAPSTSVHVEKDEDFKDMFKDQPY